MTDRYNDKKLIELLKKIGVHHAVEPDWPVFEDNYIKFMSNGGVSDNSQANQFQAWLDKNGWAYNRHRDRALSDLDARAVTEMNAAWEEVVPGSTKAD